MAGIVVVWVAAIIALAWLGRRSTRGTSAAIVVAVAAAGVFAAANAVAAPSDYSARDTMTLATAVVFPASFVVVTVAVAMAFAIARRLRHT